MMFGYDMTAAGWFWMVGGGLLVVLAILGGAWLIAHSIQTDGHRHRATPLDILQERFARGELPQEEYEKAKQALR